jgi:CRP-like cAMP-binding protein
LGTFDIEFFFTNHPIPTVGYRIIDAATGDPVFVFTADGRTNREALAKVEGMADARRDFLSGLVADSLTRGAFVLADAGEAVVHPYVDEYVALKSALEVGGVSTKKLRLGHNSQVKIEAAGLNYATPGWRGAMDLTELLGLAKSDETAMIGRMLKDAVAATPALESLTGDEVQTLSQMGTIRKFDAGDILMRDGEDATTMMLIMDGAVEVTKAEGGKLEKIETLTSGLVGEAVYMDKKVRNADVRAMTSGVALELGHDAIEMLRAKGIAARLVYLRRMREARVLDGLDAEVKDAVYLHARPVQFIHGQHIIEEGDTASDLFVVVDGEVEVTAKSGNLSRRPVTLGKGGVFGEGTLLGGSSRSATVRALGAVELMKVDAATAKGLLDKHGGELRCYLLGLAQKRESVRPAAPSPGPVAGGGGGGTSMMTRLMDLPPGAYCRTMPMAPMMGFGTILAGPNSDLLTRGFKI